MDWQAGDLALCVANFAPADIPGPKKGRLYTVISAFHHPVGERWGAVALRLQESPDKGGNTGWNSNCFKKVTPPKDMILEDTSIPQSVEV